MKRVEFRVYGVPQAKGSIRAFMRAGGKHPSLTSTNKNLSQWAALVRHEAQHHAGSIFFGQGEPVCVYLLFALPRPTSLPKKVKHLVKKPDIDKLTRALLDCLSGTVVHDDAQVVCTRTVKRYALETEPPSVWVEVTEAGSIGASP